MKIEPGAMSPFTESETIPFFQEALASHMQEYIDHFADRLVAVYAWGSIHRKEAIPGVSDMDLHAFIKNPFSPADEEWFQRERHTLEAKFPETKGLSRPFDIAQLFVGLQNDATIYQRNFSRALVFRLHYDATLLWGQDILQQIPTLPDFDKAFGMGSFEATRDLAHWSAGWVNENKTDFSLPEEPSLRLRKLARLAVLAGAWYLIANRQQYSLRGSDVLPILHESFPIWNDFLRRTEHWYIFPTNTREAETNLSAYTQEVAHWTDTLSEKLGMGSTIDPHKP